MARTTPIVQVDVLIYQRDGEECSLAVGTPAWYAWLETVTTFAFSSSYGTFTARKEQAGNRRGGWYWKAYHKRNGKLHRAYLGKSEELTLERLNAIAAALSEESLTGKASGAQEPSVQGHPASPVSAEASQPPTATPASAAGSTYASGGVKSNLQAQLPPLLGRERDVAHASGLLGQTGVRLLTFVGPGGVGKTRLALQVAAEMLPTFPDGVYFVSLAPISDTALVVPTIAQTLGLREAGSRSLLDRLNEYLYAKHLLLVLDNFEQVIKAAPLLAELLAEFPSLKVLVTSREALRLSYEQLLPVTPLALPDLSHLPPLEALPLYTAVALFIQRVQSVKPDFQLSAVNARAVVEICVRLDGLPLAIELAAAWMRLLSPQQLLTRLGWRLQVLTGGARDLPARQQTLRDTIRWSYDLLNREEQRLFRLLAVFVGGCTLEAAEAVCLGTYHSSAETVVNVLDAVISLLDKHLLQQREQEDEEPCLFMLETIREYGLEGLQVSGEMDAIRRAHASYYLALAEEAEPRLFGEEQIAEFDRLEREHENLRAALHAPAAVMFPGTSYGMGWANGPINGVQTIWHNGSTGNFYSDMILVPESQWGIVVLSNESGLTALLSGSVENIAGGVMNMLVGQKPPPSGPAVGTLYLIIDSILVLISALVLWSALRLSRWSEKFGRRWRQPGRWKRGFNIVRVGLRLVWELVFPALLLGLPILNNYITWRGLFFNAPDIVSWLLVIFALLLITAIIRAVLMVRVLRRASVDRPVVTPAPAPNLV